MKPNNILKSLKVHQLALNSEEVLNDDREEMDTPRQVRRGNVNDGREKFGDSNPFFSIPKWPKGLF